MAIGTSWESGSWEDAAWADGSWADQTGVGEIVSTFYFGIEKYVDSDIIGLARAIKLDDFAATDDNTALDATSSKHGLLSKLDKIDLDTLTDTSDADSLHTHNLKANLAGPTFSGTVTVPATNFTVGSTTFSETQLTDLTDSGDTTLHDHDGISENTTHRGSNGTDHSYIDQAVTIAATPTFASLTLTGDTDHEGNYALQLQNIPDLASKGPSCWFDGDDDVISGTTQAPGTADLSMLIDFSVPDATPTSIGVLFGLDSVSAADEFGIAVASDGTIGVWLGTDTGVNYTNFTLTDNVQTNFVFTADRSGNLLRYINGVLDKTTSISGATGDISETAYYIGDRASSDLPLNCVVSRILQFNLNLTATEVKALSSGAPVPYKYVGASQTPTTTGAFVVGKAYRIVNVGDTDFQAIGASADTIGVEFVATGIGGGTTGTATPIGCVLQLEQDSITDAYWYDKSGNNLDGTVSGAIATNLPDTIQVTNDIIVGDGGNIGSASDPDAIAISAGGDVTLTQDIVMATGKLIGTSGNLDLITIADASVTIDGDLVIASGGTIGTAGDTRLLTLVPSLLTLGGAFVSTAGIRTACSAYSPGLWIHNYGEYTAEHTNQTGVYDHTGGASEQIFTKTAGDDFTQADADNGNWILLTGDNMGAVAEIKEYLSATTVIVDGMGWGGDIASQTFSIYKHPSFVSGDGFKHEFSTGTTGEFEVHSYAGEGTMSHFKHRVNADDSTAIKIDLIGNGKNDLDGIRLAYETGDIQPLDDNECIHISIDESAASSADATTKIHALKFEKTNVNTLHSDAVHVGPGFTDAFHVSGTASIDPAFGWEVTSGAVVDRVNEAGAGDDSFIKSGTNVQIFDSVNDYILIGSAAEFEVIEVVLATGGSKDSSLEFYYSVADAGFSGWTQFYPSDSTNGFQNSGSIVFSAPALWAKDDEAEANGDIDDAFYIGIKRTKLGAYTEPTESFFKIYPDQEGGMSIRGDGVVQLPYLGAIPANPVNGMVWMESDGLHLYYGGAEKTVAGA